MELLSTSVSDPRLKGSRILLHGACVRDLCPEIYERFLEGRVPLSACPEREHIGLLTSKISTIITMSSPSEITVLTIDGSPHCLHIHHAVQQARRLTSSNLKIKHFVVEHQKLYEISEDAVYTSRHLSKLQSLITENKILKRNQRSG